MDFVPLLAYTAVISESEPEVFQDCNYKRHSFLNYTMTSLDTGTVLLCEPESGEYYCGRGPLNKTFVVRAFVYGGGSNSGASHTRRSGCLVSALFVYVMFILGFPAVPWRESADSHAVLEGWQ